MSSNLPTGQPKSQSGLNPDLRFHSSEGLTPLRPEPPTAATGLTPLGPFDGLRPLTAERIEPPQPTAAGEPGIGLLKTARRRAGELDWDPVTGPGSK